MNKETFYFLYRAPELPDSPACIEKVVLGVPPVVPEDLQLASVKVERLSSSHKILLGKTYPSGILDINGTKTDVQKVANTLSALGISDEDVFLRILGQIFTFSYQPLPVESVFLGDR